MIDIKLLAAKYGTPLFVIDLDKLKENYLRFKSAFPDAIVSYSYKTNYHPSILKELADLGAYAEIVSIQEMYFAEQIGLRHDKIIYNGLGRSYDDFKFVVPKKPFLININSINELKILSDVVKRLKCNVDIGLRMNPLVSMTRIKSFTAMNSKLGISLLDYQKAINLIRSNKYINFKAIYAHIGTNITTPKHYVETFIRLDKLVRPDKFASLHVVYMDLGGGFASGNILAENNADINDFGKAILKINNRYKLIFEPGRTIVEDACYCVAKVLSVHNGWAILDINSNFLKILKNINYRIDLPRGRYNYNFGGNLNFSIDKIQSDVNSRKVVDGDIVRINNTGAYTYSMRSDMAFPSPTILVIKNGIEKVHSYAETPKMIFNRLITSN